MNERKICQALACISAGRNILEAEIDELKSTIQKNALKDAIGMINSAVIDITGVIVHEDTLARTVNQILEKFGFSDLKLNENEL